MEVRLLGSGGFMPSDRRETGCALLRKDGAALAIDAGSGARRLVSERGLLRGVDRLHVVLTHFHLDHTHGLFYLVDAGMPIDVWAAGEALEGTATEALLARLLGSPFAPDGFLDSFTLRELPVGEVHVGPFSVRARIQRRHSNPTLAVRVDEAIAWCTDTAYDEANVDFVRGAHTLFHEAFRPGDGTDDPTHTGAGKAGRLAAAAGVQRLVLIHLDPELEDDEVLLQQARQHFASTEIGRDGASFST
jgi:ribonuclease BN (tRNA processing enzyme)